MTSRRGTAAVVLALALVSLSASTAGANIDPGGVFQRLPSTEWLMPGTAPFDGTGRYVYVAPYSPGPQQVSTATYRYEHIFDFEGGGGGHVALTGDVAGPRAAFRVNDAMITVPYQWSPGRIYFLFAYHLGGGTWGAWVYDVTASSWTFVGSLRPGSLHSGTFTASTVEEAAGVRGPSDAAASPLPSCSWFPRVDVYFSPPIGFRGTAATIGEQTRTFLTIGDCLTTWSTEYGWMHHQLGVPAPS